MAYLTSCNITSKQSPGDLRVTQAYCSISFGTTLTVISLCHLPNLYLTLCQTWNVFNQFTSCSFIHLTSNSRKTFIILIKNSYLLHFWIPDFKLLQLVQKRSHIQFIPTSKNVSLISVRASVLRLLLGCGILTVHPVIIPSVPKFTSCYPPNLYNSAYFHLEFMLSSYLKFLSLLHTCYFCPIFLSQLAGDAITFSFANALRHSFLLTVPFFSSSSSPIPLPQLLLSSKRPQICVPPVTRPSFLPSPVTCHQNFILLLNFSFFPFLLQTDDIFHIFLFLLISAGPTFISCCFYEKIQLRFDHKL